MMSNNTVNKKKVMSDWSDWTLICYSLEFFLYVLAFLMFVNHIYTLENHCLTEIDTKFMEVIGWFELSIYFVHIIGFSSNNLSGQHVRLPDIFKQWFFGGIYNNSQVKWNQCYDSWCEARWWLGKFLPWCWYIILTIIHSILKCLLGMPYILNLLRPDQIGCFLQNV